MTNLLPHEPNKSIPESEMRPESTFDKLGDESDLLTAERVEHSRAMQRINNKVHQWVFQILQYTIAVAGIIIGSYVILYLSTVFVRDFGILEYFFSIDIEKYVDFNAINRGVIKGIIFAIVIQLVANKIDLNYKKFNRDQIDR